MMNIERPTFRKWDFLKRKAQGFQIAKSAMALPRGLEPLFSP